MLMQAEAEVAEVAGEVVSEVPDSLVLAGSDHLAQTLLSHVLASSEWESNPHFTIFETASSASWDIGSNLVRCTLCHYRTESKSESTSADGLPPVVTNGFSEMAHVANADQPKTLKWTTLIHPQSYMIPRCCGPAAKPLGPLSFQSAKSFAVYATPKRRVRIDKTLMGLPLGTIQEAAVARNVARRTLPRRDSSAKGAPGGTRTPNLLILNQTPLPIRLPGPYTGLLLSQESPLILPRSFLVNSRGCPTSGRSFATL